MKSGSHLEQVLASGRFAVTAEISPPKGGDATDLKRRIQEYKPYVDAMNFVDNALGNVKMSSLACSAICLERGVEPVMQLTCRDRNLIGLQADILGASALGIRNVLCLTGDHQSQGSHAMAQGVFELDSVQLIALVRKMRDDLELHNGDKIKCGPKLLIGGAKNPFSGPLLLRVHRLGKKIAAGVDFVQTQPVFDMERFVAWMRMVRDFGYDEQVPIMAGILPCKSAKILKYMAANTPGMSIPASLITRMEQAANPEEEGLKIAVETIRQVREIHGIQGVHIMPVLAEATLPELIRRAGITPPSTLKPLIKQGG